jgi:BolA protein
MTVTMEERIYKKIAAKYGEDSFTLKNDSAKHHGHAGDDGSGQTHFTLKIVSAEFEGISKVNAQRQVYAILADEFKDGLHALALKITT